MNFPRDPANPTFTESLRIFKERLYSKPHCKRFDGVPLRPRVAVNFIFSLVSLFNERKAVNLPDLLNAIMEQECQVALNEAIKAHAEDLERGFASRTSAVPTRDLFVLLSSARARSLEAFRIAPEILERFEDVERFEKQLHEHVTQQEQKIRAYNENLCLQFL